LKIVAKTLHAANKDMVRLSKQFKRYCNSTAYSKKSLAPYQQYHRSISTTYRLATIQLRQRDKETDDNRANSSTLYLSTVG